MKILTVKLQKWITPRTVAVSCVLVYLISLIPLLWIGIYNYPSADDFTNGSMCHHAFMNGEGIFGILKAAWERMVYEWYQWRGCFTASFLSALMPGAFGERWYVLTVWIMLGMLSFSTAYLLHGILVKGFGIRKIYAVSVSALLLFFTVQCMVGRVEALYWYSGAVNYTFLYGLSLIYFGLLLNAAYCSGKKRRWMLCLASIAGFLTGGGNQMTPLNTAIVLMLTGLFLVWKKKGKQYRAWLIPASCFFAGFAVNLISPGNRIRAAAASGMNPVKAVLVSFYYCLDLVLGEWTTWPIIVFVILLILLFWKAAGKLSCRFEHPGLVVLLGYCVVSAMFTPALFAVGNVEAPRIQSLAFIMYLLVLTLCVGYVTGWARKKYEMRAEKTVSEDNRFSACELWCLIGTVGFLGFAALITMIPEPHYFTFSSAATDIRNDSAQEYAAAKEDRIEAYQSGDSDVTVDSLPVRPELLYFSDITPFPEDWENQGVCRFYELKSVRIGE